MAAVATIAGLVLSAGSATVQAIQGADAAGEAKKQSAATKDAQDKQVAEANAQLANEANTKQNNSSRDQQISQQNALRAAWSGQNGTFLTGPMPSTSSSGGSTNLGIVGGKTLLGA